MSETNQNNNGDWSKREIGALWLRKSAAGTKYLSGHIETGDDEGIESEKTRVVVFSNKDKKNDKAPDYRMYLSEAPKKTESSSKDSESTKESEEELDVL